MSTKYTYDDSKLTEDVWFTMNDTRLHLHDYCVELKNQHDALAICQLKPALRALWEALKVEADLASCGLLWKANDNSITLGNLDRVSSYAYTLLGVLCAAGVVKKEEV